ncbi:Hypothetical protein ORPV_32 [Orpheovirus IHUMI-LCC2]|uniref:Uncharacterized protein n=1 Tax=Orpheovirus IHUMI-LCC2 TaxID=2023057 RepID=A0A2I2L332_9VIRU|nr:Hypothetical protein ORPV_32 [Orpheovirus IHUMI-LCC2]SNW61936.1 Hypothetical protein ORPV_32 [Orpheovirus IHUMI-LCC2]
MENVEYPTTVHTPEDREMLWNKLYNGFAENLVIKLYGNKENFIRSKPHIMERWIQGYQESVPMITTQTAFAQRMGMNYRRENLDVNMNTVLDFIISHPNEVYITPNGRQITGVELLDLGYNQMQDYGYKMYPRNKVYTPSTNIPVHSVVNAASGGTGEVDSTAATPAFAEISESELEDVISYPEDEYDGRLENTVIKRIGEEYGVREECEAGFGMCQRYDYGRLHY